ncbi:MAG: helix-turn-helix transcriptional regulator [Clostridia bacterium]|nr:helix-turn-helix transcriptional regulator [Clostridia bacterium]
MEFNEKLQELRKQKNLTQEELAKALFVSRTAVSKWESGKGYPGIDSLRAIAAFFDVTVDQLLSSEQVLTIAKEEQNKKEKHVCDLVYGFLDCCVLSFLFLPLFAQKTNGIIQEVSLISLTEISLHSKAAFYFVVLGMIVWGILTLALQNCSKPLWIKNKSNVSLLFNSAGIILFIASLQPYAAVLLFIFLMIKFLIRSKKQ